MNNSLLQEGGPVLLAIIILAIGSVIVFVERLVYLHKARIRFSDFLSGIFNILSKGKVREAIAICDEAPGPVARLMHSAILHRGESKEGLRLILDNAGRSEIARMERRITVLSTIIQIAPLLGLLGSLLGIFNSVVAIRTNLPIVQTIDLTSGLFQSLITAIAGLATAIPAYVMYNILVVRIDRIVIDMEQASTDILAFITNLQSIGSDESGIGCSSFPEEDDNK